MGHKMDKLRAKAAMIAAGDLVQLDEPDVEGTPAAGLHPVHDVDDTFVVLVSGHHVPVERVRGVLKHFTTPLAA